MLRFSVSKKYKCQQATLDAELGKQDLKKRREEEIHLHIPTRKQQPSKSIKGAEIDPIHDIAELLAVKHNTILPLPTRPTPPKAHEIAIPTRLPPQQHMERFVAAEHETIDSLTDCEREAEERRFESWCCLRAYLRGDGWGRGRAERGASEFGEE